MSPCPPEFFLIVHSRLSIQLSVATMVTALVDFLSLLAVAVGSALAQDLTVLREEYGCICRSMVHMHFECSRGRRLITGHLRSVLMILSRLIMPCRLGPAGYC